MRDPNDFDQATILFDLAHAMRSPMLTLLGFAELAQDAARDPSGAEDLQRALAAIERSALRLNRLIEDLVNLARLKAPLPGIAPRSLCLEQLLTELIREAERTWVLGDVTLSLHISKEVPPEKINLDERSFRIAVGALLRNAVEATGEQGEVRLVLAFSPAGTTVTLENGGEGLGDATPQAIRRLFDAGVRGEDHSGMPPGLGLGLTLARRSAEAMGARVELLTTDSGLTRARLVLSRPPKPGASEGVAPPISE